MHALLRVLAQRAVLRGVPQQCVACGTVQAETFHANVLDYEASFCKKHLVAFLNRDLEPKAFRLLAKDAGDPERVHLLHSDFYNKRGQALQPGGQLPYVSPELGPG
jgi:hypothetical protein